MNFKVLINRKNYRFFPGPSFQKTVKMIFLLLPVIATNLSGQTDSLERVAIDNVLESGKMELLDYNKTGQLWNTRIKTEMYPDQPVDNDGKVHYIFNTDFKGHDKKYLYNRTLEWLAIYYDLLPVNVYANPDDGKIIFNIGLTVINNYSCSTTTIISIQDEKIRVEMVNITYQVFYAGSYEDGIPDRTVSIEVYPIILKKYKEWDLSFSLLRETKKLFNSEVMKYNNYITKYEPFK